MAVAHQLAIGAIDGHDLKCSIAEITFTTPYATGGDVLTPSNYGMSSILFVVAEVPYVGGGYAPVWNPTTGKIALYGSGASDHGQLDEISNSTAIGTVTTRILILGKPV